MPQLNQKGAIHLIILLILLGGIAGGVYLATREEPLKLFPFAKVSRPIPRPTIRPRPTSPSAPIPPRNTPKPTRKPNLPRSN